MVPDITIAPESPASPAVRALLAELDAYLASLYEPEANHILDVEALQATDIAFLTARDATGRLLGCGAVRRMPGEAATAGHPYGELKRMMVQPAARGQGVGARLIQALEGLLQAEGRMLALLETGHDQHAAVRLYQRCGYRPRGPFAGYPDNGLSLFMQKTLAR